MARVIPIKLLAVGPAAAAENAHVRLERAGFMRMMVIGEPRLSELVNKYKALGYEVEVLPYEDTESSADSDSGYDTNAEMSQICGTIYVRKRNRPIGESKQR
jgi:hypothetical protein